MSLILDALSRAQRDKQAAVSTAPDLLSQSPGEAADSPSPASRSWWLIALLAVLAIVLLAGVFALALRDTPKQTITMDSQSVGPAALREPAREVRRPAERQAAPAVVPLESPRAPAQRASIAALYADARIETSDPPAALPVASDESTAGDGSIDLGAIMAEVERASKNDGLSPHPTPLLEELSKQFRDSVPSLLYLRHDFNSSGASTVFVNGTLLRVGQRTKNVEVREILEESAVFRYGEVDFRLRALNSWVNL